MAFRLGVVLLMVLAVLALRVRAADYCRNGRCLGCKSGVIGAIVPSNCKIRIDYDGDDFFEDDWDDDDDWDDNWDGGDDDCVCVCDGNVERCNWFDE